ncbi:MAG TPA: proline racemase family protein [Gemmatimonadaceae bacterium]|nr:proline racemase family protein [Gemmatimonadaceae bacterium]
MTPGFEDAASAAPVLRIHVVDSHTEGEPTRVVVGGWPPLHGASMTERRDDLRARFDHLRAGAIREPRGHSAVVGALLTNPVSPRATAGVIFFNNGTYLGMCGHGLIGVVRTLEYLGRLRPGPARFDTPVGTVVAELSPNGEVTIENVPAFCHALDVAVDVPGVGRVVGDIGYGGNWFFITHLNQVRVDLGNAVALRSLSQAIQVAIRAQGIRGADGADIDHIDIAVGPSRADADAKNFVLCSGGEFDRSPCGTGTSATMAVLHARGALAVGELWRQESVCGSLFTGWLTTGAGGELIPHIRGTAYVTGEATLVFDERDPFRFGLPDA